MRGVFDKQLAVTNHWCILNGVGGSAEKFRLDTTGWAGIGIPL